MSFSNLFVYVIIELLKLGDLNNRLNEIGNVVNTYIGINNKQINVSEDSYKFSQFFNNFFMEVGNQESTNHIKHSSIENTTELCKKSFDNIFNVKIKNWMFFK